MKKPQKTPDRKPSAIARGGVAMMAVVMALSGALIGQPSVATAAPGGSLGKVQVSKFDNLVLGNWTGTGALSGQDEGCVWSSSLGYTITATGDGPGGSFVLQDGPNDLAFQLFWSDELQSRQAVQANVTLTGQVATAVRKQCQVLGLNTTIEIYIPEANLAATPAGSYQGDLLLLVAAE